MASLIGAVRTTGVTAADLVTTTLTTTAGLVGSLAVQASLYNEKVQASADFERRMIPMRALNEAEKEMIQILIDQHKIHFPNQPYDYEALAQEAHRFLTAPKTTPMPNE